jgi:hypothetical protein
MTAVCERERVTVRVANTASPPRNPPAKIARNLASVAVGHHAPLRGVTTAAWR